MNQNIKSFMISLRDYQLGIEDLKAMALVLSVMACFMFLTQPLNALAQQFDVPFITAFGCSVVKYMKGPLAVLIFVLVVVSTLVIGMIAKMDWARIITVCVVFGIVIAIGSVLANSDLVSSSPQMAACLQ